MDTASCVYEDKAVIHELTQGLQMAQQLRVHLHSPKARNFYIQMILSSYYNALCVLRSSYSAEPGRLPVLPESLISFESPGTNKLCQQSKKVIPRKSFLFCHRKELTSEDQVRTCKAQKCFATKQMQDVDPRVFTQPASPSPEKHDIKPSPGALFSNLRANLSVNTSEDYQQLHYPNYYDYELTPIYSPVFISPVTSESTNFTEWGSSQSLNFLADPADVDTGFDFGNSLF
ncbi:uncharacterized protein LOC143585156 [Bidens hawaiensis]|uniref:uncharacterized protein LOC143585156 n=1 Tax=Bidens hawaiensis TaxID=980011 RepID=UPI00404ACB50